MGDGAVPAARERYDVIGEGYAAQRRPEPRWMEVLQRELDGCEPILNVGAGAGSYEPGGKDLIAVEPSFAMLRQRPPGAAPVVCARAECLPFPEQSFGIAMAVLTVHHWQRPELGLAELARVAARQVVVTWDPAIFASRFWLVRDYLPEVAERDAQVATVDRVCAALGPCRVRSLPVPADCRDGFLGAFWSRPAAYLDPLVRRTMSGLSLLAPSCVDAAMKRLRSDLTSGAWQERNADLLGLAALDMGYRLVVSDANGSS